MSTEPTSSPSLELAAVAALVGGTLRGDGARRITGVAPLDRATAGDLSFVASARYLKALAETGAGALLVGTVSFLLLAPVERATMAQVASEQIGLLAEAVAAS